MMSGIRNSPPISISSPRETTTSRPWASVSSARRTAAALLLTTSASSAPVRRGSSRSTEGRLRSAVARSALIERGLDPLPQAGDDVLRLVAPRLGRPLAVARLPAAAHGVLDEPRPQLVEVGARQALAAEGARPVLGEALDEPVALGGEAPCLPDEVRQPRGHAPSAARAPARYRGGSPRTVRSTRTGRRAWDGT